jgi:serine/threonine protein kinase
VFEVGEVLAGKYRVERILGQGGMGVVLAARHLQLDEPVAIKLMLSDAASNPDAVGRFVREARAAARLQSAHVARVSDVGTLEDGRAYMVMEYLDGCDLAELLENGGPLAVGDAVDYLLQASEAIAEAHSLGIVHRDLKPSNLFLTRRRDRTPHIKVLDFGISKVVHTGLTPSQPSMTQTSTMMGSPFYMSPEQMTSARDVDGRTDIWGLGIVLYELLVGAPPFVAETLPQICVMVLQSAAPKLRQHRADVPPELEVVLQRCLAKQPSDRFENMAALAVALRDLAGPYGRASVERILLLAGDTDAQRASRDHERQSAEVAAQTGPDVGKRTHAAWGDAEVSLPIRRSLLPWAGAATLVVALGSGAAWWAAGDSPRPGLKPEGSSSSVSAAAPPELPPTPVEPLTVSTTSPLALPSPAAMSAPVETPPTPRPRKTTVNRRLVPTAVPVAAVAKPLPVETSPGPPAPAPPAAPKKPIGMGGRL